MWEKIKYEFNTKMFLGWTKADKIIVGALTIFNLLMFMEIICGL